MKASPVIERSRKIAMIVSAKGLPGEGPGAGVIEAQSVTESPTVETNANTSGMPYRGGASERGTQKHSRDRGAQERPNHAPLPLFGGLRYEPRKRCDPRKRAPESCSEPECNKLPHLAREPEEQARERHCPEPCERHRPDPEPGCQIPTRRCSQEHSRSERPAQYADRRLREPKLLGEVRHERGERRVEDGIHQDHRAGES